MGLAAEKRGFDDWVKLAQSDPDAFEKARQEVIEQFICEAPEEKQNWLRCIQWRVDQVRRTSTPLGACVKISNMMMEAFAGERGLIESLEQLKEMKTNDLAQPKSADIYNFPGNRPKK